MCHKYINIYSEHNRGIMKIHALQVYTYLHEYI